MGSISIKSVSKSSNSSKSVSKSSNSSKSVSNSSNSSKSVSKSSNSCKSVSKSSNSSKSISKSSNSSKSVSKSSNSSKSSSSVSDSTGNKNLLEKIVFKEEVKDLPFDPGFDNVKKKLEQYIAQNPEYESYVIDNYNSVENFAKILSNKDLFKTTFFGEYRKYEIFNQIDELL